MTAVEEGGLPVDREGMRRDSLEPRPTDGTRAALDRWCAARRKLLLGAIAALAILLRLVYFVQLDASPLMWQHLWPESDMSFFDDWGRSIADGDWAGESARHPNHEWHRDVAALHFAAEPELHRQLVAEARDRSDGTRADQLLWNRWLGGRQFHQEPLYAYLIGATYRLLGADVRWVFAWQLALGLVSIMLLYLIGRRAFGETAGLVAALMGTLFGPLLTYELVLLRATLLVAFGLALVQLLWSALGHDSRLRWAAVGLASGAAFVLKTTYAPFGLAACAAVAWRHRRQPRSLCSRLGWIVLGGSFALAPFVTRNVALGLPPLAVTSVGALAFVAGSGPHATADVAGFDASIDDVARVMGTTDGALGATVVETLAAHDSLLSPLRLWAARLLAVFHWYEAPQNGNVYAYRMHAPVLGLAPLSVLSVAPLALLGLFLGRRGWRDRWPLELLVLISLGSLVVFSTVSRYRIVLMAALLPYAAYGSVRLACWVAERRVRPLAGSLVAVALLMIFVGRPLPEFAAVVRATDHVQPYRYYHEPLIAAALDEGRPQAALELLDDALRHEAAMLCGHEVGEAPASMDEARVVQHVAGLHLRRAELLTHMGRDEEAALASRRGNALLSSLGGES